jgi:bifunctional ADP-heptose synthase (sugar kinase/adenylyltransferase)
LFFNCFRFKVSKKDYPVQYLAKEDVVIPPEEETENKVESPQGEFRQYEVVALGGTFDRMHNAHKILLTEAVLRCTKEIIVGVTSDDMIKSKRLHYKILIVFF